MKEDRDEGKGSYGGMEILEKFGVGMRTSNWNFGERVIKKI